ncbi:monocarboxylate transporter 13 [Gadus morhua]|uniref:Major facilitator superfamily (MFS) profile domain-containing protein n=1 Tax=Gadus morhua TaxID=8049 RepID=A0A8C5BRI3_GADMO|nr:monocarboxylate transporter 13-like [Gadus morhua]
MKPREGGPPDGGYGWVVVASSFIIMGLTAGVMKNLGLFFLEIQRHFGVLNSTASWVTSTTIAMFHLAAPVASSLSLLFSHRAVIVAGGILSTAAMVLASLDLGLPWMYCSLGVLQGTGMSLAWVPCNSMVSHYFQHWRPVAYALASCGECVFAAFFSLFFQWLIDAYTWQSALLLIGGLQLNLCVCGALMRPLGSGALNPETGGECAPPKAPRRIFHWSLLRRPELLLYILFAVTAAAGFFIPPLFLVPHAARLGMDPYRVASVLSVLATADLAGRLFCGWLAHRRHWRNLQLLTLAVTALGVVVVLLPLGARGYWATLAFSSLYGFLFGCVVALHVTAIVDVVGGLERFDSGLGLFMMFRTAGGFLGPPAAGWLVDETNDFSAAFFLSGFCLLCSGVFVLAVDVLVQKKLGGRANAATQDGAAVP